MEGKQGFCLCHFDAISSKLLCLIEGRISGFKNGDHIRLHWRHPGAGVDQGKTRMDGNWLGFDAGEGFWYSPTIRPMSRGFYRQKTSFVEESSLLKSNGQEKFDKFFFSHSKRHLHSGWQPNSNLNIQTNPQHANCSDQALWSFDPKDMKPSDKYGETKIFCK